MLLSFQTADLWSGDGAGMKPHSPGAPGYLGAAPPDVASLRRLSAPAPSFTPASRGSSPTSPVRLPLGSARSDSPGPVTPVKPEAQVKLSTDAWVCPNDRQLALRAK